MGFVTLSGKNIFASRRNKTPRGRLSYSHGSANPEFQQHEIQQAIYCQGARHFE
jgi:hypothetical protein